MSRFCIILFLATACSARSHPNPAPIPAWPAALVSTDTTPQGWAGADSAAMALGFMPLRGTSLPEGDAEIRLWTGSALGMPLDLVRLTLRRGRVDGMAGWYWFVEHPRPRSRGRPPLVPIDSVLRYSQAGQCTSVNRLGDVEACVVRLTRQPHWRAIWDSVTRLGIWTLPDQASLPPDSIYVSDGWWMSVELRSGSHYRSFEYSNPGAHKQPEQQQANSIGRAADEVWGLVPESSRMRTYRGRLDVFPAREGRFTVCGSDVVWSVEGELGSLWQLPGGTDSTTGRSLFVEVRGMLATPGLVVQWRSKYGDVLEIHSVLSSEEWSARSC